MLAAVLTSLLLPAGADAGPLAGVVDEAKLGTSIHDIAIGADHKEPGTDINSEVLFVSPSLFAPIFSPRPHLGVMANSAGKTSWSYAGLTWSVTPFKGLLAPNDGIFAALGLGGAVHTGNNASTDPDRKGMGTTFLFHEYAELGYRDAAGYSLSAFLDHVSNANTAKHNPGITDLGVRVGYKF